MESSDQYSISVVLDLGLIVCTYCCSAVEDSKLVPHLKSHFHVDQDGLKSFLEEVKTKSRNNLASSWDDPRLIAHREEALREPAPPVPGLGVISGYQCLSCSKYASPSSALLPSPALIS